MGIFKKSINHSKGSNLDEKLKLLESELKKTNVTVNESDRNFLHEQKNNSEVVEKYDWRKDIVEKEEVVDTKEQILKEEISIIKETKKNTKSIKNVKGYTNSVEEELSTLRKQIFDEISENFLFNIPSIEKKIDKVLEIYSSLQEGLLNQPPDTRTTDPLTPLDQNFVTVDDLNKHYTLFINRVQEQLATFGGGGETQLKYLDDVVGIATNPSAYDGKFLKYDHSLGKFIFETVSGIATYASVAGIATVSQGLTGSPNIQVGFVTITGVGNTALVVNGDVRITGILTVGESSITLDGSSNQIKIGSGVTITANGGASYSGVVTATSFIGDGSGLTNLPLIGSVAYATTAGVATSVIGGIGSLTELNVSGISTLQGEAFFGNDAHFTSNHNLYFGDSNQLAIFHDGSYSKILNGQTFNDFYIGGDNLFITNSLGDEIKGSFITGGSVELYYHNVKKFETTPSGTNVIGGISASGISTISVNSSLSALSLNQLGSGNQLTIGSQSVESNRVVVTNTGSIGVATANPTSKLHVVGNVRVTGIVTALSFSGNSTSATYATTAGVATYASTAGVATHATYSTSSGVSTDVIGGIASVTSLTVTDTSILGTVQISSGIITATSGIVTYYGDGSQLQGIVSVAGITVQDEDSTVGTSVTTLNFSGANVSISSAVNGISTVTITGSGVGGTANYADVAGIATYAALSGISSYADIAGIATYASLSGISSYSNIAGIATYASVSGVATYATLSGIASYSDVAGIATYSTTAGISSYADVAGIATYSSSAGIATVAQGLTGSPNITVGIITGSTYYGDGTNLSGIATDNDITALQAQINSLGTNLNIVGFYDALSGIITSLTVVGQTRSYIGIGSTLPQVGIVTGDYFIVSTGGTSVGIASYITSGISTVYPGDWIVGVGNSQWSILSYSAQVVAPRATKADIAITLESYSNVNTTGIITASKFVGAITAGVSTISVNSSSDALRITQEGSGNAFVVEDSTNPDSTPFVINTNGSIGIGTTNPISKLHVVGDTNISGVVTANQIKIGVATSYASIANGDYSNTINLGNDLLIYHITDPLKRSNWIHSDEYDLFIGTKAETGGNSATNVLVGIYTGNDAFSGNTAYVSLNYGFSDPKLQTVGSGITVFGTTQSQQLNVTGTSTFAGITTVTGNTLFAKQLNISGVSTFAGITTVSGATLFARQLNTSGIATLREIRVGATTYTAYVNNDYSNTLSFGNVLYLYNVNESGSVYNRIDSQNRNTFIGITTAGGSSYMVGILTGILSNPNVDEREHRVALGYGNNPYVLETTGYGVTVAGSIRTGGLIISGVSTFAGITTVTGDTLFAKQINVAGVVTATDFNSASDAKLKTNIRPIENPIDKVSQIQGVTFNWIETNKPSIGVIADDLKNVLPDLVTDTDPKTVNYNGLVGLLIEVVKEQQEKIKLIEDRITNLESLS